MTAYNLFNFEKQVENRLKGKKYPDDILHQWKKLS
jgi:hypothetical protein